MIMAKCVHQRGLPETQTEEPGNPFTASCFLLAPGNGVPLVLLLLFGHRQNAGVTLSDRAML